MKNSVIKEMSTGELLERLTEETKQLARLKINHAVTPLENPMKIQEFKTTIARIKTELRRRELNNKN
jgi:large subunit ribosomal protein L29